MHLKLKSKSLSGFSPQRQLAFGSLENTPFIKHPHMALISTLVTVCGYSSSSSITGVAVSALGNPLSLLPLERNESLLCLA